MKRRSINVPQASQDDPAFSVTVETPSRPANGLMLFVHGLGYSRRDYSLNADRFPGKDVALVHAVMRGHPTGIPHFSLDSSALDLGRILDAIDKDPKLRELPMTVLAHSVGALVALMRARHDTRIRAICGVSIITSLAASMDYLVKTGRVDELFWGFHHAESSTKIDYLRSLTQSSDWRESFTKALKDPKKPLEFSCRYGLLRIENYETFARLIIHSPDALEFAKEIHCPTVLFCGRGDEMIDPTISMQLHAKLSTKNEAKEVFTLPGGDHFLNAHWDEVLEQALKIMTPRNG